MSVCLFLTFFPYSYKTPLSIKLKLEEIFTFFGFKVLFLSLNYLKQVRVCWTMKFNYFEKIQQIVNLFKADDNTVLGTFLGCLKPCVNKNVFTPICSPEVFMLGSTRPTHCRKPDVKMKQCKSWACEPYDTKSTKSFQLWDKQEIYTFMKKIRLKFQKL